MEIKVKLNNLRIAPRKVRQVADLIRGKRVEAAQSILSFTVNRPAKNILKLLNSAIASAKNDFKLEETNLFISKIFVDEGPKLKRWHPMSRGRAYPIMKRTSHITLVLSELNPEKKEEKKLKGYPEKEERKIEAKKMARKTKRARTTKRRNKK